MLTRRGSDLRVRGSSPVLLRLGGLLWCVRSFGFIKLEGRVIKSILSNRPTSPQQSDSRKLEGLWKNIARDRPQSFSGAQHGINKVLTTSLLKIWAKQAADDLQSLSTDRFHQVQESLTSIWQCIQDWTGGQNLATVGATTSPGQLGQWLGYILH